MSAAAASPNQVAYDCEQNKAVAERFMLELDPGVNAALDARSAFGCLLELVALEVLSAHEKRLVDLNWNSGGNLFLDCILCVGDDAPVDPVPAIRPAFGPSCSKCWRAANLRTCVPAYCGVHGANVFHGTFIRDAERRVQYELAAFVPNLWHQIKICGIGALFLAA
jgi:hypothetical protein